MLPILPTAPLAVTDAVMVISWLSPAFHLTPLQLAITLAELAFGIAAIAALRHVKTLAQRRPAFFAKHWSPADVDLPNAA